MSAESQTTTATGDLSLPDCAVCCMSLCTYMPRSFAFAEECRPRRIIRP